MKEKTTSVLEASTAIGLNINKEKSKILPYNIACTSPITVDGEYLEDVKTFTYLGSIIDEQGRSDADVRARFGKASEAYLQLKDIWNSKQYAANTKIRISNTNVKTVLLSVGQTLIATTNCGKEQTGGGRDREESLEVHSTRIEESTQLRQSQALTWNPEDQRTH
ncbi:unnamed protein product [Schistosoma curassoni]|uniref:DUF6451 domain-containing protein n=1 Tax=Schistosoma curassoni TaxID=6186 RepID=A0A183K574_9TREM|nr:unnamed protein product [Schistosoma curassoni]